MNRGWISLPIIALLLGVSALSMTYQKSQLVSYKWLGQLKNIEEENQFQRDFELAFVESPNFTTAIDSECMGFCPLAAQQGHQEKAWQRGSQVMRYQWHRYTLNGEGAENYDPNRQSEVSYRLCATDNQHQYQCWWWRDSTLLSNGWVSFSD
ncbi:hypothetical protein [Marinomonas transparens]|uniref:Uncharacterized protein n=1 Tax=Marinomonas transparens TaxID=2795388 RepID=A0A934JSI5_9GAMM|nr:hypothetical protein [Marinomonas transparens]MBJ7539103.1 hypothetical protein [Marinomonas transparens]